MKDTRSGVERIAAERQRQKTVEGFDASHDAQHDMGELVEAGVAYAMSSLGEKAFRVTMDSLPSEFRFRDLWPENWDGDWDRRPMNARGEVKKPSKAERLRVLEKAGALLAAEIDRLLAEDA